MSDLDQRLYSDLIVWVNDEPTSTFLPSNSSSILFHSVVLLAALWPTEPIIRLRFSELCGPPPPAQRSVVKQKHGLFTGFGFPSRCLWPGVVAKCQAESERAGSRTRLKRAIVFPRLDVIGNTCPPSSKGRLV